MHADLLLSEIALLKDKAQTFLFLRDVSQHRQDEQSGMCRRGDRGEGTACVKQTGMCSYGSSPHHGRSPAGSYWTAGLRQKVGFLSPTGENSLQTRNNQYDLGSPVKNLDFTLKNLSRKVGKMCSCSLSCTQMAFALRNCWYAYCCSM